MAYFSGKLTPADVLHTLLDHMHHVQHSYPTLADGVVLTTEAGDWALGTLTEIIPAGTISRDFDIHEVVFETVNTKDKTYELQLFYGATDIFASSVRVRSDTNKGGVPNGNIMTPIIPAESVIKGRLAIEDGGNKTAVISTRYHTY